jgi:hypothetical protein
MKIRKEASMRRWQRAGIAGVLALAALILRPRQAGEPDVVPEMQAQTPDREPPATESSNRTAHAE